MSDSIADLTKQPKTVRLGEREYRLHPLEFNDFGALQAWCDEQAPDPYDEAYRQIAKGRFTRAQEQHILATALDKAMKPKPKLGEPECDALLRTPAGAAKFLHLSIAKGDTTFTLEQAAAVFAEMANEQGQEQLRKAVRATTVDQVLSDPKARSSPFGGMSRSNGSTGASSTEVSSRSPNGPRRRSSGG